MILLGNFLLHFILSCWAEDISPSLGVRSTSYDPVFNIETTKQKTDSELHQSEFGFNKIENDVVPNVFVLSNSSRQERAIEQFPPHKAFHEFHHEPVRPRVPGRRRTTRPGRPPSDTPAPRRFPEGDQYTIDERMRSTLPARRRTKRPKTTVQYPQEAQTKRTRLTTDAGSIRSTRPSAVPDVSHDGRPSRRTTISGKPFRTSGATRGTRRPGVTEPSKRITLSGITSGATRGTRRPDVTESAKRTGKPSRTSGATRGTRRPDVTESAKRTGKPSRTSGATRGTRRPGATKPSGQFPPHKDFHDFHNEPVKPRLPGRRRTTVQPRATRIQNGVHHSVTPVPKTTALIRESSKPRASTKYPDKPDISQSTPPIPPRRSSSGRRVTQRRKTTSAGTSKITRIPDRYDKVTEKQGVTPRPGVTRRHTDRGHRRSKKPTSIPSEFTRGATHSQSITQSSKALPPHKAFHEFHSDPIKTKIPDSKTSETSIERTTPIYPMLDIAPSETPRFQGERGRHRPASSQKPRAGKPRFLNGVQSSRPTTDQRRKTTPGRRRTTMKPDIPLETSAPRQRRPSKRPTNDFDVGKKVKPSSASPRQFPGDTRPGASKPLPPHKAFHEFHFEPVRPRIPGNGKKTNGIPAGTPRPVLPSQYPNREFTAQRLKPKVSTPQSIWPRVPGGDRGFITQQPAPPSFRPDIHLDTRPETLSRFTDRQRPTTTPVARKQATTSGRPGSKRRKPTSGTKRPGTPEEKTLTTLPTPSPFRDQNKQKPTRRTQNARPTRPSDGRRPSVTSRPLPPHKAFHDFHFDSVKPNVPRNRVTGGTHLGTPYPGERRKTQKQRPTHTLSHGIQPRFPNGDNVLVSQKPDLISGTQRHPNGKTLRPTGTRRPGSQSRRPNGRRKTPVPGGRASMDTQTSPMQPEYQKPSESVTPPIYSDEEQVTPTPVAQGEITQPRISSDHSTESTPEAFRPRTKPRFPGDRGTRLTTSTFPEGRRTRTQRPRFPGSTNQPIKIPPHKAFHEFHYAPVRPRFFAGS